MRGVIFSAGKAINFFQAPARKALEAGQTNAGPLHRAFRAAWRAD
jgi:hypothetical protein